MTSVIGFKTPLSIRYKMEVVMDWIYANQNHSTIVNEKDGVVFLTVPKLVKA